MVYNVVVYNRVCADGPIGPTKGSTMARTHAYENARNAKELADGVLIEDCHSSLSLWNNEDKSRPDLPWFGVRWDLRKWAMCETLDEAYEFLLTGI